MFTFKQKIKPLLKFQEENQKFIIYKHTNKITGKCYIGQTCDTMENRWRDHVKDSKKVKPRYKFQHAIKKYKEDNFTHEILEELDSELFTNAAEKYWIKKFNSLSPNGYNLTDGGDGGRKSEETKSKMRDSAKIANSRPEVRQHKSAAQNRPEIRQRNSEAQKIIQNTSEARLWKNRALKGKPKSEDAIRNMSEAQKIAQAKPETRQRKSESSKGKPSPLKGKKQTSEHITNATEARRRNKELKKLSSV